ncbi:hypothetical protein CKM354_000488700 [Cercospora kikuchii]|uniref:Uncharacterized protein n=1 Tax=Cercospora kikuchii TaxID=84275 RepID=A0A9P3CF11_9PEZI|nr:uncharacterized protein CKM354_000488700 [Cercospora kikuchii]GIZ41588.1 hypothetical protein CKM354_000488700 [Cercospora kikuchii]
MDPSWYGGHNPYTQARMRELKKRELELSEVPHQAERPPLRAYYSDQGPYGPREAKKTPLESRDGSSSNSNGLKDQVSAPVAGPSNSRRPGLKSFYTDQGAYGPGYGAAFGRGDDLGKAGAGSSKRRLKPVPEEDEASSSREDDRPGRSDRGKGKQTASESSTKNDGGGTSSSQHRPSIDGASSTDNDRPELQTRRSRGWFF